MDSNSFQFANNSLTSNFILPEDKRPNLSKVSSLSVIPIIDLHDQSSQVVDKISKACSEYGFFQVINHGVPEELCKRMMSTIDDFFALPPEERAQFTSTDQSKPVGLFSYFVKVGDEEKIKMWSETFIYLLRPLHDIIHLLPENPPQFRDVVREYGKEVEGLMLRLLGFLSEGLGLPQECLINRIGANPSVKAHANYYPPCPNPDLTLGLNVHTDLNALTVLLQSKGVTGLQVIKDGNWVSVDPVPNAFVVNIGDQIQVLSNGRFKSVHHRVVTNMRQPRISYVMFYGPNVDTVVGPIEELIDEEHPCLYRSYRYEEFLKEFRRQEGTRRMVKEVFQLDVVREYGKEVEGLMLRLLGFLSEGLGLPQECLINRIGANPSVKAHANYYPPCPNPDLTLGLNVHTDLNALTVLLQSKGVTGLQVIKDGNWVAVDPVPNAFVVNIGDQIQVLSNGRFKSVHHRVVTNMRQPRISYVMFYGPNVDTVVGPIEELIDEEHPCLYRSYRYEEFLKEFRRQGGTRRMVKEVFQL